jgi:hypothetical protein
MNSWYNNTFDDTVATDPAKSRADVDWMNTNRFNLYQTQFANLYISSSLVRNTNFPDLIKYGYGKNIKFGVAYSETSQVDNMLAYNSGSSITIDKKLWFAVTELEPYNTGDYAGMTAKMEYAYPRLKAAGLKHGVYMGWPTQDYWSTIVKNCDFINLHCYRTSNSMTASSIWGYVQERLGFIATACKNLNKIMEINIIYSCEPDFAFDYFKANKWTSAHQLFLSEYNTKATTDMKRFLVVDDFSIFVTKYGKQIKP